MNVVHKGEVTGRTVLLCLLGFFAIVTIVNAVMITAAVSTFGGVETESSYKAGLAFAKEMAAARRQDNLHWDVRAAVVPHSGGRRVEVLVRDAAGRPPLGIVATARLSHPSDRRADRSIELRETSAGRYVGETLAAAGQWDLIIELTRDGQRQFRSKNRLNIETR